MNGSLLGPAKGIARRHAIPPVLQFCERLKLKWLKFKYYLNRFYQEKKRFVHVRFKEFFKWVK